MNKLEKYYEKVFKVIIDNRLTIQLKDERIEGQASFLEQIFKNESFQECIENSKKVPLNTLDNLQISIWKCRSHHLQTDVFYLVRLQDKFTKLFKRLDTGETIQDNDTSFDLIGQVKLSKLTMNEFIDFLRIIYKSYSKEKIDKFLVFIEEYVKRDY